MNYIKIQIEAKQFTIDMMKDNVELFGGAREVAKKIDFLRFEIMQLNLQLDSWH